MSNPTGAAGSDSADAAGPSAAPAARGKAPGFRVVNSQPCLKKIVDPTHRHAGAGLSTHGCPYQLHLDRLRLWRTGSGELFATAEPHQVELADLAGLVTAARELGVAVRIDGRSGHDPERAFTILITQQDSSVSVADLL